MTFYIMVDTYILKNIISLFYINVDVIKLFFNIIQK